MLREHAYKVVQTHAMQSWETGSDFRAAIASDSEISKYLKNEDLERSFGLERQLRNVDAIFRRVFGS
jgi:adenylosuccinate lyase